MDYMLREILYEIEKDNQKETFERYRKLGLTDVEIFKYFIKKIPSMPKTLSNKM